LKLEFPSLVFAYNMTLRNISSIDIPALQEVNSTFGFYGDYLTSITAPNLTLVGGDLAIVANSDLTNISMPLLKTVGGGVTIANNSALLVIDGFSSLKTTGAINMSGNFTSAVLPALGDCKGTFNMQSSGNISCTPFDTDHTTKVIKGAYFCAGSSNDVQSSGTPTSGGSSGTGSGSSPTGTGKGAAGSFAANMFTVTGLVTLAGAMLLL